MARKLKPYNQLSKAAQWKRDNKERLAAQAKGKKKAPAKAAATKANHHIKADDVTGLPGLLKLAHGVCTRLITERSQELFDISVARAIKEDRLPNDVLKELTKSDDPTSANLVAILKTIDNARDQVAAWELARKAKHTGNGTVAAEVAPQAAQEAAPAATAADAPLTSEPAAPAKAKRKRA